MKHLSLRETLQTACSHTFFFTEFIIYELSMNIIKIMYFNYTKKKKTLVGRKNEPYT